MRTPSLLRLSTWLALFVASVTVPLLTFAGFELWSVLDADVRERDAALSSRARATASAMDTQIRSWRAALFALAETSDLREGRFRAFQNHARAVAERYDAWVTVIDASGQQLVNTLLPAGTSLPRTAAGHIVKAVLEEKKPVTDFAFGAAAQRYIVSNAVPAFRDGTPAYCLAMNFGTEHLNRLLEEQKVPPTWVTALVDSRNVVVARSSQAEKRVGKPAPPALQQATAAAAAGVVTYNLIDGRSARVAFQRLTEVPWTVTLAVPMAELPSMRSLVGFGWAAALLGLVAIAAAAVVGRRIARPIRQLADLTPALGSLDAAAVDVGSRVREVDQLQRALVEGTKRVHASTRERDRLVEELRRANDMLEARVQERTAALERALADAEVGRRLLDALMENIPEGIAIVGGPPDFPFKRISRYGQVLSQRPAKDLDEVSAGYHQERWSIFLSDGVTRPTPEQMPLYRASRFGEEVRDCEMVVQTSDGRRVDVLVDAVPIRDADGAIIGATNCWRDITKRKQMEAALETARADAVNEAKRLEAVMQALPVGMALVDAGGGNIRANAAFEQVWGSPRPPARAVADYALYKAWWPDTGQPLQPHEWASTQVLRDKRPVVAQLLEIERFDGTHVFVLNSAAPIFDAEGEVVGAAVAIQDITALRKAQEELRTFNSELEQRVAERTAELAATVALLQKESAERIAADQATRAERQRMYHVLETLPVYVILLSADYHVPFANRFFRERFGESHGRCCFEYLFGRAEPCENCESYKAMQTGAPHHWEWTGPDGRNYDIYDFPFTDTDGTSLVLEMGIDITEQKRAESALKAAHDELSDRADRLRALAGELTLAEQRERRRLADVLHDELQQLLVATRLRAHMLGRVDSADVRQGAQEIAGLMDEALGVTRSLAGELNPPGLQGGGLLSAITWLGRWMREKHRLTVHAALPAAPLAPLPEETAVLLYQATRECLLNVVKYARVAEATVTVLPAATTLTIAVTDAGVGFDPGTLRVGGGTEGGVGLLGIRERLESLGGRLEIASRPGEGSRFDLTIPWSGVGGSAAPTPSTTQRGEKATGALASGGRLRVLIVDDHAVMRRGVASLLAGEPDLEVVGEAENGQQAIELAGSLVPDVILMDVSMPVLNGIEATRVIHADFPAVRVIGLSMVEESGQADAMRQAGAVGYVRKRDAAEVLLAAIRGGGPAA